MSTPRKHGTPRRKSARLSGLPPRLTPRKTTPRKTTPTKYTPRRTPKKTLTPAENAEPVHNEQGEEGITVAIRMRPLNTKESNANRVWKVLPKYNSVTQTTNTGQPLPERVTGRTFFTFDKTFGEDADTIGVYDSVAKGIVESVVSGLNGTIFAYGQTSSGKTFTMQGSGSIEEGYTNGGGGIVHMAANDIFSHVQNTPDRIFLIRASFIEIYNEEVRDLLGENAVLAVREDPRRGVFVNSVEEIVTDFEGLLHILFAGEKNRAVASTGMNERSSRSHTIFRITIESRTKTEEFDENDMGASNSSLPIDDDGAVLISTLNLVDLAGSESVRHTGSTGERQKEGGKINQSLLTLSRVIVGLGQPNQTHINFRDSKLTRILQPSLSGNARMAVICCATPSELYLEETRSTLLFASRAKLVKTRAQVNEVLDDRSLIKRLQRELAEARQIQGPGQLEHLKALKTQASDAGAAARDAEMKLNKLKSSILNHAVVFRGPRFEVSNATKKRRLSDGSIAIGTAQMATPPKGNIAASSPQSVPQARKKAKMIEQRCELPVSLELEIIKEAHNSKVEQNKILEERVEETEKKVSNVETLLSRAAETISALQAEKEEAIEESQHLSSEMSSLFTEMQAATLRHENAIAAKDALISEWADKLKVEQSSRQSLEVTMNVLMKELESFKDSLRTTERQTMEDSSKAAEEKAHLEETVRLLSSEKSTLIDEVEHNRAEQVVSKQEIVELKLEKEGLESRIDSLSEERVRNAFEVAQVNNEKECLAQEKEAHQQLIKGMSSELSLLKATMGDMVEEKSTLATKLSNTSQALSELKAEKQELVQQVAELTGTIEHRDLSIASLQDRLLEIETTADALATKMSSRESELEQATSEVASLTSQLEAKTETITNLQKNLHDTGESYENDLMQTKTLLENATSERAVFETDVSTLRSLNSSLEAELLQRRSKGVTDEQQIEKLFDEVKFMTTKLEFERKENEKFASMLELHTTEKEEARTRLESVTRDLKTAEAEIFEMESEHDALKSLLEAVVDDLGSTEEKVVSLKVAKDETERRLAHSLAQIDTVQEEKQVLSYEIAARETVHVSKLEELHNAQASLEESRDKIASLTSAIAEFESDRESLKSKLEVVVGNKLSTEEQVAKLQVAKDEADRGLSEALAQIDTLHKEKQGLSDEVACREAVHVSKLEELHNAQASLEESREKIASLTSAFAEMESDHESLKSKLEAVVVDKSVIEEQVTKLQLAKDEAERRLNEALTQIDMLNKEKQGLSDEVAAREAVHVSKLEELHNAQASLGESRDKIASLTSAIAEIESDRESLKSKLDAVVADKSVTDEQVTKLQVAKDEAEKSLTEALTQIEALQGEKQAMPDHVAELHLAQLSLKGAHAQIETLESTIAQSQTSYKDIEALKVKLQEADVEANELKQLLAAANDSVNEAREAALTAEDELQEKEKQLVESLQRLSQSEEELRVVSDELSRLNGQASSSAKEVLTKQMEVLSQQIAAAEAQLENERKERVIAEDELKRIMSEEQRALVQEAEDKLAGLKENIAGLTSLLSSAEAEAYSLRQEMEDLQDQNKRLENKALEADLFRQSEKRLKDQVSALSEARLALQSELTHAKQELVSRSKQNDREVVQTIAELSRVKSECHAAKQECIDMKEDVQRLVKENSSSAREVRLLREKSANLEATVSKLEEENQELMSRLRKLELAKIQEQENAQAMAETKSLHSRIRELESSIKSKDSRIKKLSSVKLTKDQVQAIERIKEERSQFSTAADEYRAKLASAETTISQLQAKVTRMSRDVGSTPDADEMASMKFAKEALETKLRKYAAHCQRLENEKANVLDALKSVNGSDVEDGDVTRAIITLCDKHSSLEEECEALVSAEQKASLYLSELDHLRETNSHLQRSFSDAENKLAKLTHSEADLTRKLDDAKDKVASLRKERDHLKALSELERGSVADLESEKSRQVRYLEQENLQLMLDLKNAKKQLKSTRAQLDAMRMTVVDDETEDFGSIAANTFEASRGGKGDMLSVDSSDPASPVDKENQHENAAGSGAEKTHGTESARKRRFASVNRSAKKVRNTASRTLGLGEAGSVNEDHTGECKQS